MTEPLEIVRTTSRRVMCDGSGDITPALGHPRRWHEIGDEGYVDCGYCDRRFVLVGSAHDSMPGDIEAPDEDALGR